MAGTAIMVQGIAMILLALVMSCNAILQTAADSTVQNAAYAPILVNGRRLLVGQILKLQAESGKSTTSVNLKYVRDVTGIEVRNGREYLVIDNQSGGTGLLNGRLVRTLDLVEGRKIETSF